MPELPEVEKARRQLELIAKGKRIAHVQSWEDTIVYAGVTHDEFAAALRGRTVASVGRKGKNFFIRLRGSNHTPILHFGMSGFFAERGKAGMHYSRPSVATTDGEVWPPKYVKLILRLDDGGGEDGEGTEWAFCDPRRLARIKLVEGVAEEVPPLSLLGADPLLDMPTVEALQDKLSRTNAPIKAVLLDQNKVFCGIGNWVADEVLYQAALHPSHPAALLTPAEVARLHAKVYFVCRTAVDCDSDSHKFPKDWLFSSRWGKAKKKDDFILPDGSLTKITFLTVGGRTSAVIEAVQKLPAGLKQQAKAATKAKAKGRKPPKRRRGGSSEDEEAVHAEEEEDAVFEGGVKEEEEAVGSAAKKRKAAAPAKPKPKQKRGRVASPPPKEENVKPEPEAGDSGRRRSGRHR